VTIGDANPMFRSGSCFRFESSQIACQNRPDDGTVLRAVRYPLARVARTLVSPAILLRIGKIAPWLPPQAGMQMTGARAAGELLTRIGPKHRNLCLSQVATCVVVCNIRRGIDCTHVLTGERRRDSGNWCIRLRDWLDGMGF
jgi:hypothetical protein